MAEPIKPVSRLEDASLGNSDAIAEARRATSSERQSMAVERTMQRGYRRAVRKGDMQAISVLGNQMSDMGLSRTGGGGIQDSQENNRIASERAFNRADLLNQAGGRGSAAPEPQRPAPHPFAPNVGQGAANEIEAAAGSPETAKRTTNGQTGNGTIKPNARPAGAADQRESRLLPENNPAPSSSGKSSSDNRSEFIADLDKSQLFKDGDSDAIERAVTRGKKFGITRDQIASHQKGWGAKPSDIARQNKFKKEQDQEILGDFNRTKAEEAVKNRLGLSNEDSLYDKLADTRSSLTRAKDVTDDGLDGISRSQDRTRKFKDKLDSGFFDPVVEPPITRIPSAKVSDSVFKELDPKSAEYWNIDPKEIATPDRMSGSRRFELPKSSDPRYPVMKIIQDSEDMMNDAFSHRRALTRLKRFGETIKNAGSSDREPDPNLSNETMRKQHQERVDHEVIWRAAKEGVNLTDYARHRGPKFFSDYQAAKNVQTRINSAWFHAEEIKAKAANLIPSR